MRGVFVSCAAAFLWMLFGLGLEAQSIFLPAGSKGPQASTGDELDAFGLVYEAQTSSKSAAAAESFLKAYPDSQFVEHAAAAAMHSYHEIGNWQRSKELAELVLRINSDNVDALLHLARLLVDPGNEEAQSRTKARRLADRGLSRLKSMNIPQSASSPAWLRTRNSFAAVGASVLGWLCFREGKMSQALEYLQQAAQFDGQGEYFYRLSVVTAAQGDSAASREWASRAMTVGPESIRELARRQLALLEQN